MAATNEISMDDRVYELVQEALEGGLSVQKINEIVREAYDAYRFGVCDSEGPV